MSGWALFLLAAVGIGLFVSSLAATMQQAMLYSFLVMMPFALLSGLTTPISSMPQGLQYFTLINPLRYAIEIAQRVYLEGAGLDRARARPLAAGADRAGGRCRRRRGCSGIGWGRWRVGDCPLLRSPRSKRGLSPSLPHATRVELSRVAHKTRFFLFWALLSKRGGAFLEGFCSFSPNEG